VRKSPTNKKKSVGKSPTNKKKSVRKSPTNKKQSLGKSPTNKKQSVRKSPTNKKQSGRKSHRRIKNDGGGILSDLYNLLFGRRRNIVHPDVTAKFLRIRHLLLNRVSCFILIL
jgi:hypothetical protein